MVEEKKTTNLNAQVETAQNDEGSSFDLKTILSILVLNWKWFLLSVFITLCCALLYLRYKSPVFQVSAKILVKDDAQDTRRSGANQMLANMQDLGFISNSAGIDNEVEILQSHILAKEAVKDLKLYTEYKTVGRIKDHLIYNTQRINVDLDTTSLNKLDDSDLPVSYTKIKMQITEKNGRYTVTGVSHNDLGEEVRFVRSFNHLPVRYRTPVGYLTFSLNTSKEALHAYNLANAKGEKARDIIATIYPPSYVAARYVGSTSVEPTSKTTSIALITVTDKSVERAQDYLRQIAVCYNRQANADKNEIAVKTEEFINSRLEKINAELGLTEGELESYKRRNNLVQLKLDATENLAQRSQLTTQLTDANTQIELLKYLREFIDNPSNKYQLIPSNVGLVDAASTALINQYNSDVLERNRQLLTASELAPQVRTLTSKLNEVQGSIRIALDQASKSASIKRRGIEHQYALYQERVSSTPEQERVLTQIGRQQEVKSGLYLMLLQKREENSISLAATADKGKLIDNPMLGGMVSPKRSVILLAALVIGFCLPLLVVYVIQMMRYKIEAHEDVVKLTKLPIVAEVAVASENAKSAAGIVVQENQNNQIDEIFRSMRTNIQFMLGGDEKVIMFTSSTSGEGKTFNAANLAVSFALLGKKVVLMGLDIRKPALARLFGITDKSKGISPLLTKDKVDDAMIQSQIVPSGVNGNLSLLMAGPTPPNPTELLARKNLQEIIDYMRRNYDYVILDTAPVGLVTDTLQIGKQADVTVVVCRADYTPKSCFGYINELSNEKKLPNMCIVLNGIDMSKKKYGYYYGYGKYAGYGAYGHYGTSYGGYGSYAQSHYGKKEDNSIKIKK